MNIKYLLTLSFAGAAALVCVGCGTTKPARFYNLDAVATPSAQPPISTRVMVGPISIPASVDRPEFVLQVESNRVEIDEFNRWSAPLSDAIARAVAADLSIDLGTPDVATAPLGNFNPSYRVTIDVQRFESTRGKEVVFDAVWAVNRTSDGDSTTGRTTDREATQGDTIEALAAAHSRATAKLSSDIASAIRLAIQRAAANQPAAK